jgi:hypothetical protein
MAGTTLRAAAFALAVLAAHAAFGVDTAGAVTSAQATCLVSTNQVTYAIVRALHSTGSVDTTAASAVAAFRAAGASSVGVYAFPCELLWLLCVE